MNAIVVRVLVENSVADRGLMAEHGLSFYIQSDDGSLLFDAGQSNLLILNAQGLGVDLARLEVMALSHGHYDHSGGLGALWERAPQLPLHAHPAVLAARFSRRPDDNTVRAVGIGASILETIQLKQAQVHFSREPSELLKGVFLTGEIPRVSGFEDAGGRFFLDQAGTQPDLILDDQAMFFDSRNGLVVLLGCAHAGVINTLQYIRRLRPGRPFHAVIGGMHLVNAGPERIERTVDALRGFGVEYLGPAHCTGAAATACLWHEFPKACAACSVGSRFVFHR